MPVVEFSGSCRSSMPPRWFRWLKRDRRGEAGYHCELAAEALKGGDLDGAL